MTMSSLNAKLSRIPLSQSHNAVECITDRSEQVEPRVPNTP